MHPQHDDLTFERVIRASREAVWEAWTTSTAFAQWWIPEPYLCRVEHFAPHAGGGFVTSMSEDGLHFSPHMDAAFLVVDECERLVFTNAARRRHAPQFPARPLTGECSSVRRVTKRRAAPDSGSVNSSSRARSWSGRSGSSGASGSSSG